MGKVENAAEIARRTGSRVLYWVRDQSRARIVLGDLEKLGASKVEVTKNRAWFGEGTVTVGRPAPDVYAGIEWEALVIDENAKVSDEALRSVTRWVGRNNLTPSRSA